MKLRKDQRYTMYCILLEEAERPSIFQHPETETDYYSNEYGICFMWYLVTGQYYLHVIAEYLLPELYKKGNTKNDYWFINWDYRIEALKQCIAETENF